jgi:hypothetical protein
MHLTSHYSTHIVFLVCYILCSHWLAVNTNNGCYFAFILMLCWMTAGLQLLTQLMSN